MKRSILMHFAALLACVLAACAGLSRDGVPAGTASPADVLAKVQAGAAYLDATLGKVRQAVATAKEIRPDKAAAITARVEPAVTAVSQAVGAYDAAVAAQDAGAADSMWTVARGAVTAAVGVAIEVLEPQLLMGLLGV
jgi:hypothetical protein